MSTEGLDRELENARVLLEDKPWCDSPEKYRRAAEEIILRFLVFDPENKAAKALLEKSRIRVPEKAAPRPVQPPAPAVQPPPAQPPPQPMLAPAPAARPPVREPDENLAFVAQVSTRRTASPPPVLNRKNSAGGLAGIALIVAIAAIVGFLVFSGRFKTRNVPHTAAAASASEPVSVPRTEPGSQPAPVPAPGSPAPNDVSLAAAAAPEGPAVVVKAVSPVVAPIQTGTLAISSPTTIDIYLGDQFVGSAPTTLELPAGNQSLEYRHQGLRKVVTHVIKPNETTTATITFDIPVQINARPWAQVSIDGSQRQPLGQTPLSDVKVPIGSMLLFENPNYPSKTYRVTGQESEIRVSFP